MMFKKENLFTIDNYEKVKLGSYGYFSNDLSSLKDAVKNGPMREVGAGKLTEVDVEGPNCFSSSNGWYEYFYLLKSNEPKNDNTEFKEENLYTCLNKDKAPIGAQGLFVENISDILSYLENKDPKYKIQKLDKISSDMRCPFGFDRGRENYHFWPFFYKINAPKYRPFKTCEEVESVLKFGDRIIRKSFDDRVYYLGCETGEERGELKLWVDISKGMIIGVENLLKSYTTVDGRPLGIEEEDNDI